MKALFEHEKRTKKRMSLAAFIPHFFRLKRLILSRSHPAIPRDNKIEILKVFKRKGEMIRNSDTGKRCHFLQKRIEGQANARS